MVPLPELKTAVGKRQLAKIKITKAVGKRQLAKIKITKAVGKRQLAKIKSLQSLNLLVSRLYALRFTL